MSVDTRLKVLVSCMKRAVRTRIILSLELADLRRRQKAGLGAAQQQIELRGFLQFLDRVDRGVEVRAGDDGPVISQQYGMVLASKTAHRLRQRHIAGAEIGDERQRADSHHVISSDRRQYVGRVDLGETGDSDRMRRVQMDNS